MCTTDIGHSSPFSPILGPNTWEMGNRALASLSADGDPTQRGNVVAGRTCGMVATAVGVFSLLWLMFMGGLTILSLMLGGAHS